MTSKAATLQEVALLVDGPLTDGGNSETSVALSYLAHPFPKPFQHRQCQRSDRHRHPLEAYSQQHTVHLN